MSDEGRPPSPFDALVGPVEAVGTSPPRFRVAVGEQCANTMGRAHGGFLAAVVDIATGRGTRAALADGRSLVTISTTTDLLGPARVGDVVEIDVAIERSTSTVVFSTCRLSVDGRPVARASVVFSAGPA